MFGTAVMVAILGLGEVLNISLDRMNVDGAVALAPSVITRQQLPALSSPLYFPDAASPDAASPDAASPDVTSPGEPPLNPTSPEAAVAVIRVSNQTYHPIRLVLLPVASSPTHSPAPTVESGMDYGETVHWDFVPREGHDRGLLLALPDGQLQVQPGDILTAFAQDGSRRYWGPYVISVTDAPIWNAESNEWELTLQTPFPF